MKTGNHTITVYYDGDSERRPNYQTNTFEVLKINTAVDATVKSFNNQVEMIIKLDERANGAVRLGYADNAYDLYAEFDLPVENGTAKLNIVLPYGSYKLDVAYMGDENFNQNFTEKEFTISQPTKENTTIALDIIKGENNVAMTVTVNENATGLVKFQITGQEKYVVYSDVIGGKAILNDVLEAGKYSVVVTYMGDNRFNTNLTFADFTIQGHIKKNTPIFASAMVNGNRVTLTVTVDENATGFVKMNIASTIANLELENGVATVTSTMPANSYLAEVTYLGDENFNANSTKLIFTVVDVKNRTLQLA